MNETLLIFTGALLIWNGATFLLMGLDKSLAKRGARRISEKTLLLTAFLMGGPGSLLGSMVFRHKTKKMKFKILLPCAVAVNILVIWAIWRTLTYYV